MRHAPHERLPPASSTSFLSTGSASATPGVERIACCGARVEERAAAGRDLHVLEVVAPGRARVARSPPPPGRAPRGGCRPRARRSGRSRGCAACAGRCCAARSASPAAGSATRRSARSAASWPPTAEPRRFERLTQVDTQRRGGSPAAPRAAARARRRARWRQHRRVDAEADVDRPEDRAEVAGEQAREQDAERDAHQRPERTEQQRRPQVDERDLAPAGADRPHDPDLARLLGHERAHGVRDQDERREQRQERDHAQELGELLGRPPSPASRPARAPRAGPRSRRTRARCEVSGAPPRPSPAAASGSGRGAGGPAVVPASPLSAATVAAVA